MGCPANMAPATCGPIDVRQGHGKGGGAPHPPTRPRLAAWQSRRFRREEAHVVDLVGRQALLIREQRQRF